MDVQNIDLPTFLDALSWGDEGCIQDAKIQYARSSLMHSAELPEILRRWHKPPARSQTGHKRMTGARRAMEKLAADWALEVLDRELEYIER
ncbi:hypothetical protein FIBSPDRAFT_845551 [Athelia psychrophila]|uniref:Uncharacterized protein n=1 Tax=Athelia psychrophila TaxID=1759441 RepID=A0A167TC01_9AGAM|nr:hypothetical protein FIBSPDRAFT_845551 [Fibularhizoctonia sp. CBS 109695]